MYHYFALYQRLNSKSYAKILPKIYIKKLLLKQKCKKVWLSCVNVVLFFSFDDFKEKISFVKP